MQQAVSEWYHARDGAMRYTDTCQGPYCNPKCPDKFVLIAISSNNWPSWAKMLIIALVVLMPIACMLMKGSFVLWLFVLERKQLGYLNSLHGTDTEVKTEFKVCIITS